MPEVTEFDELPWPDDIPQKVGQVLLSKYKYAHLGPEDLDTNGKQFSDFVADELGLDSSLQERTFAILAEKIPPPVATSDVYAVQRSPVLTREQEMAIRKLGLGVNDDMMERLDEVSGKEQLAGMIIDAAEIWRSKEDNTLDPNEIRNDITLMETMQRQEPTVITLDGRQCFAIRKPSESSNSMFAAMAEMLKGPTFNDFLVVTDPDENSRLASHLFSQPNLLRFYMGIMLVRAQSEKVQALDEKFGDAASKKFRQIEEKVAQVNAPIQLHAFNLLLKEAKAKESITLIDVMRDHHDVATIKGESPPKLNRTGSESNYKLYKVTAEGEMLIFTWTGSESHMVVDHEGAAPKFAFTPVERKSYIRQNPENNRLEYKAESKNEIKWTDGELYGEPARALLFFNDIQALSIRQRLETGPEAIGAAEKIIPDLLTTMSSAEFFARLREHGAAGYPAHEILVETDPKVHYVIEAFPQQFSSETIRGN